MKTRCLTCFNEGIIDNLNGLKYCPHCGKKTVWQDMKNPTVILNCTNEHYDVTQVEFRGVSEDLFGTDVLSFKCPKCGKIEQSFIFD